VASSKGLKESQDGARCGRGGRRPLPVADNVGVADPARRGPQRKRQGAGRLRERAMNYDVRAELGTGQAGKLNTALDGAAGPWGSSPDDWVTAIRRFPPTQPTSACDRARSRQRTPETPTKSHVTFLLFMW
jgi:hypothetical protein